MKRTAFREVARELHGRRAGHDEGQKCASVKLITTLIRERMRCGVCQATCDAPAVAAENYDACNGNGGDRERRGSSGVQRPSRHQPSGDSL